MGSPPELVGNLRRGPHPLVEVRGAPLRYTISYLRSNHGDETYAKIVAAVSPDVRGLLERDTFLTTGWYPIAVLRELQVSADRVTGTGDGAVVRALWEAQAEARLLEAKEALAAGPLAALGRLAREWRTDVRNGVYVDISDRRVGSFEIEFLVDHSLLQDGWLRTCAAAWFAHGARLAGAQGVETTDEVDELTNDMRQLTVRVRWTP